MARLLLIVSRAAPERLPHFSQAFANLDVEVLLDRRVGERRRRQSPVAPDRRHRDRRTQDITRELETNGWAMTSAFEPWES